MSKDKKHYVVRRSLACDDDDFVAGGFGLSHYRGDATRMSKKTAKQVAKAYGAGFYTQHVADIEVTDSEEE